jgi:protease I
MAKIAFVLADDFEDDEFRIPYDRMRAAGHEVSIIGLQKGRFVEGKRKRERVAIGATPGQVSAADFDALLIPGGYSPDHLRMDLGIVKFVRDFGLSGRPIAAVCHGPSLLIEADLVDGKKLTSWPSIHTDLVNAGAHWEDQAVVQDGNLITSRNPGDLSAFSDALVACLGKVAAPAAPVPA